MKRLLCSALTALGTGIGMFALYAVTHPVATALVALSPYGVTSDRDAKVNLRPVQSQELLRQIAALPTLRA